MRKLFSMITGVFLLLASFLPAGAFAADNPNSQKLETLKAEFSGRTQYSSNALIKSINPSLEKKVLGALNFNSKSGIINAKDTGNPVWEQEPNDNPANGEYDYMPLEQDGLLGYMDQKDVDYHQISVPNNGTLLLAGVSKDYHRLGFVLFDSNGNTIDTSEYYFDPNTGILYEVIPNLQPGTYYVADFDMTSPADDYTYEYAMYAAEYPDNPIVNPVSMGDKVVTGTADPNDTVYVTDAVQQFSGTVDKRGNFSVAITPQKTGSTLTVQVHDSVNDTDSNPITVTVQAPVDTTAPDAPQVNPITDKDTTISGTAEYGSTITIKNGSNVIGTTVANDKTGDFQFTLSSSLDAGTVLSITATDKAGNVSKPTNVTVTSTDTIAPNPPQVNPIDDNDRVITGNAENGSTITVNYGSITLKTTADSKTGNFQVNINPIKAGTVVSVTATDKANNVSKPTNITVLDKTPPAKPSVNPVSDASTSVTGKTEAYAIVTVKAGSKVLGSKKADSSGGFAVGIPKQMADTHLNVYAVDAAGNKSPDTVVTVLDKTPPAKPTVYTFGDNQTVVSGKAEAGSKVTIKYGKTVLGWSTASSKGDFHVSVKKKQRAGEVLTAYATDKAGNQSAGRTFKVVDKTPPGTPTVNKVTTRSTSVSGKAEKGATVYLYSGHHYLGKTTSSSKGYYTIKIHRQKKGTWLSVFAKDKAGNKSKTKTIKVV